jgi:hypothetical protein
MLLVYLFISFFLHTKRETDSAAGKSDKILIISCCLQHARKIKQQNSLWDPVTDPCTWDLSVFHEIQQTQVKVISRILLVQM